jgi:hypothetical protein
MKTLAAEAAWRFSVRQNSTVAWLTVTLRWQEE